MAYIGQSPLPVTTANSVTTTSIQDGAVITQKLSTTGVSAATYGNATIVPVFTVGADGRITESSNVAFTAGATLVNDVDTDFEYLVGMANAQTGAWTTAYVSNTKLFFNSNTGTLSATNFNNLSDEELKTNITVITNATATVKTIEGVEFNWKDSGKKSAGFIAQKIESSLPHLVATNTEGMKSVNYSAIIAYLVETIKELDSRVKELEKKNGL